MITKLEKLQQAVNKAQSNLDRLKAQHAQAEQTVMDDPSNNEAALEAARLELQIKAVQKGVDASTQALRDEQERLESPEAKADYKELDKLNKAIEKKQGQIIEGLEAINEQFDEIQSLHDQAKAIARKYDKEPYNWELGGFLTIRGQLLRWTRMRQAMQRSKEIMDMPGRGVQPVQHEDTPERRRMLKQRYHKPDERV